MQPARKLATFGDLQKLPEGVRAEIADGVIVTPRLSGEAPRTTGS